MAVEKTRETIPVDEVDRYIAERVEAAVTSRMQGIQAALAAAPPVAGAAETTSWMEGLALAIANVTDQDVGRKRVAPEVLAKRVRAREAMEELIKQTIASGDQPTYTLRKECYLGERMIPAFWVDRQRIAHPTEIGWWGIPNQFFEPVNEPAKAIFALFLESIGDGRKGNPGVRITAGGLVVRSGGMPVEGGRDSAPRVGRDLHDPVIKGRASEGSYVETRVLGTLLPPARQMV